MKATLQSLKEYQEVLIRIAELDRLLNDIPPEIESLEQEWKTIQGRITELNTRKEEQGTRLKELRVSHEEAVLKYQKFESDLHEVTNTKEYHAVLKEIDAAKKQTNSLEEDSNQRKTELEEIDRNIEECTTLEKESRGKYEAALKEHKASLSENKKEMDSKMTKRDKLAKKVPERMMKQFKRIASRRNGVGLAFCIAAVCRSCNVRVRQNIVDELRKFNRIITCESCKRILFFADGDE